MDDNKLLPKLSQNLLEILNDEEYYDVTIEVGHNIGHQNGIVNSDHFDKSFTRVAPEHLADQLLYLQDGEFEPDDLYSGTLTKAPLSKI
ncbi:hypothetical protein RhiirA5_504435 [Rhizophagus irregularis]|uniref:Uncharacterized protein n=1 Tax=Rhizophagus irregularis TaxID=588596 RepID=A0A2N0P4N4_9GLOM|nr:hypothetical protein RhiirA5_504435 [Rhizophagus irregularis]